nr:hypothetical protein [Tanacetum cinerariifolium]
MTRSSTNELFTPYKEPEQEFRSSRRLFKILSLDELRLPDFNLLSKQEYSEEEIAKTMAEIMKQYMSKTRADYGSRAFPMSLTRAAICWLRNKPTGLITNWDGLKIKFLNKYCPPTRTAKKIEEINNFQQEPDENLYQAWKSAIPSKMAADAKIAIQEMVGYSQKWHNETSKSRSIETSYRLAAIQAQLNNLGREIKKEKDTWSFTLPCFINNVCFDNALVDLGASVSVMPLLTYLNLGLCELAHTKLTVELADMTVKYPKGIAKNVLVRIGKFVFPVDFILDMPENIKVPLILGRPFLSTAHAKIDVYKIKITLSVREEKIVFISVKPTISLIKRVYMLSLRERMKLELEARLVGETLVLNRSLDHFFKDYIELNDLNEPFELRRNQGNNLMPTVKEGEVIKEFRTRDEDLDTGIDDYPRFKFTHANFFTLLYVDVMSKKFHNFIMKDKMVYKGDNVVGALINVPIFVGNFSVVTDLEVLENIDAYRDKGMGDVIIGELFLREVTIKTRRFEGMVTIYNGNNEVTYQMVRSHLRFKRHTHEQCKKIPPLLKVNDEDKMNEISHPYQKLKGFYKGVLNLGPGYILDAKMEEWLTREHISVHEME